MEKNASVSRYSLDFEISDKMMGIANYLKMVENVF